MSDSPLAGAGPLLPPMMRLEERIVLDAAGGGDAQQHSEAPAPEPVPPPAPEAPANPAEPAEALLVSSAVAHADTLAAAAHDGAVAAVFPHESPSLAALLEHIRGALGDDPVDHLALATHGIAPGEFHLIDGQTVNLAALQNPELRAFWAGLAELIRPGGRIDLLACNAADGPAGIALVHALEDLTGVDFAASHDTTGNPTDGGDWTLETDDVALVPLYFDSHALPAFKSVLIDPPTITDTNPGQTAVGGDAGGVIVDPGISVAEGAGGNGMLQGAAVRIRGGFRADQDQLACTADFGISASYDAATGTLILSGPATPADYQTVLRSVRYINTSTTPDNTPREILFTVGDVFDGYYYNAANGHYYTRLMVATAWTTAQANAAAMATGGLQGYLATITSAGEHTFLIPLVPTATPPPPMPPATTMWIGASDSIDGENQWYWVTGPEANLLFWSGGPAPAGSPVGGAFAAWLGGHPSHMGASYAALTQGGGWQALAVNDAGIDGYIVEFGGLPTDAEGNLMAIVTVNVQTPNHAPVLDNAGVMLLSAIQEDHYDNAGNSVAHIISSAGGNRITDYNGDPEGIAVTGLNDAHGTWQYSLDGGATWIDFGAVSSDHALLLRSSDFVRFRPDADYHGDIADGLTFRAWDRTTGTAGGYADTTLNGGDTAFSSALESAVITVQSVNDAPLVLHPLVDQPATQDTPLQCEFSADSFHDVEGDALVYTATRADGSPLPAWLHFDPLTRTFSGTPDNDAVGTLSVKVTANDGHGGTADAVFDIDVANVNDAPRVQNALANQRVFEDGDLVHVLPADAFLDIDADDHLTFSATLADGSPLPEWLIFDPLTRTFTGTPHNEHVGVWQVRVTATDEHGASASDVFALRVRNTNDAPVLVTPLPNQIANAGTPYSYHVPADAFADEDVGDTLTFTATLANGNPLPAWLIFDPVTRTFTGTPGATDGGSLLVRVTVTDGTGAAVSDVFRLVIAEGQSGATPHLPVEPVAPPTTPSGPTDGGVDTGLPPAPPAPPPDQRPPEAPGNAAPEGIPSEAGPPAEANAVDGPGAVSAGPDAVPAPSIGNLVGPDAAAGDPRAAAAVHPRDDELLLAGTDLHGELTESLLSGSVLDDASQPAEFRAAWDSILGAYADTGEDVAVYLESAFRTVTESALIYQSSEQASDALRAELELLADQHVLAAESVRAALHAAQAEVKAASTELEAAIRAAAAAGDQSRFDRVLEDVVQAALQRLMTANENLYVQAQALTATTALLRDARLSGNGTPGGEQLAAAVEDARSAARERISEMRKSWDRVAQDVFSAFVKRLVAQRGLPANTVPEVLRG